MRKGDIKKQAILDVSERLFYQNGFEQTSVQDVLDMLKTSKGSFYHHFDSKLSVLETLCIQRAGKMFMQCDALQRQTDEPLAHYNQLLYYAMPLRKGEERFMSLLLPMAAKPEGTTLCTVYEDAITASFSDALEKAIWNGCNNGTFFCLHVSGMSAIVLSLLNRLWREIAGYVSTCANHSTYIDEGHLMSLLDLYRYAICHLVEAPYGSVEIIRLSEITPLLNRVLSKIRTEK